MEKTTAYYVTFWSPGSFVAEDWSRPVASPDPHAVAWPDNAYAFRMFKRDDVKDKDGTVYQGKPEQLGPTWYHPDSSIQSLDEVRSNPNASRILISNMENNRWAQIIWTRWNNWPQTFDPKTMQILKPKN